MRPLVLVVTTFIVTASPQAAASEHDPEIARLAADAIRKQHEEGNLRGFDLDLKVSSGKVLLTGFVSSARHYKVVAEAITGTDGVVALDNRLRVRINDESPWKRAPTPPADDTDKKATSLASHICSCILKALVNALQPVGFPDQEAELDPRSPTATAEHDGSAPAGCEKHRILTAITRRLAEEQEAGDLRGFNIDIGLEDQALILTGHVSTKQQFELVEAAAASVQGVRQVDNRLGIGEAAPGGPEEQPPVPFKITPLERAVFA
jgi:osmotically-inducible protein OsmY